jgi:hypothetical protein
MTHRVAIESADGGGYIARRSASVEMLCGGMVPLHPDEKTELSSQKLAAGGLSNNCLYFHHA